MAKRKKAFIVCNNKYCYNWMTVGTLFSKLPKEVKMSKTICPRCGYLAKKIIDATEVKAPNEQDQLEQKKGKTKDGQ